MSIREEVLGKRVEIAFEMLDETGKVDRTEFFQGTITSVLMELADDGRIQCKHYVTFEDGEQWYFDLLEEERLGNLRFIREEFSVEEKSTLQWAIRWLKRALPQFIAASPNKKQKLGTKDSHQHGEQLCTNVKSEKAEENLSFESDHEDLSKVGIGWSEPNTQQDDTSSAPANTETIQDTLDESDDDDCSIPSPERSDWPTDLPSILRFMDRIEPGQKYFERNVDTRGECPKISKMLLAYVKYFPNDPAVTHFLTERTWEPPDRPTLRSLVRLLRTMLGSNQHSKG